MKRLYMEADVNKIIKDLQGDFGGDNESQMKGVQLIKGLATSDDAKANEFMKKLNTATTKISKEVLESQTKDGKSLKEMETDTIVFYSWAASALINADASGLTDEDEELVDRFEAFIQPGYVVDVAEESYFGHPDPALGNLLPGDVTEYTIMYR